MPMVWSRDGENEFAREARRGAFTVGVSLKFCRPPEVDLLIGSAARAKEKLGWKRLALYDEVVALTARAEDGKVDVNRFIFDCKALQRDGEMR